MSEYVPIKVPFNLDDKDTDYYVLQKDQSIEQNVPELYGKFKEYKKVGFLNITTTIINTILDIGWRL